MPFPLAHPAAVLPLRRLCPALLSLPALMIGSLTPDMGYVLQAWHLQFFSHSWLGSLAFCLPVGLVCVATFYGLRESLVATLPTPHREALEPLCRQRRSPVWSIVLSLVVGALLHDLLDAVSREAQALGQQFPLFRAEIASLSREGIHFYRFAWYGLSVGGLLWLGAAYLAFLQRATGRRIPFSRKEPGRYLLWAAVLAGPLGAIMPFTIHIMEGLPLAYRVRHVTYHTLALYVVIVSLLIVLVGLVHRVIRMLDGPARQ
jgi:hypothetical protein